MLTSIIGTKVGMTQIFDASGNIVPVTVVSAGPCVITGIMTKEKNGYTAVQLGYGEVKETKINKSMAGLFKKANVKAKRLLRELRVADIAGFQVGQEIKVDIFKPGDCVDVFGISKGKGFAGGVKRHGFRGGPASHGQSDRLRAPGSIGSQGPQRVLKGMRMAGHMGNEQVTVQKLEVVVVDAEKNMLLLKGAVPGVNKGILTISRTIKKVKPKVLKQGKEKKKGKGVSSTPAPDKEKK